MRFNSKFQNLAISASTGFLAAAFFAKQTRQKKESSSFISDDIEWLDQSGGCNPDFSPYPANKIIIHNVNGTNEGPALALLRANLLDPDTAPPLTCDYPEAIKACVETAFHLAVNLAEAETHTTHECGDPDCGGNMLPPQFLYLGAVQKFLEFAVTFTNQADSHANECDECKLAGKNSPGHLRAQFCHDLADDLATNYGGNWVALQGVPIPAVLEVLTAMLKTGEEAYNISVKDQIEQFTQRLVNNIAIRQENQ